MIEKTYFRLQQSEGNVCSMASRIFAAFIASGQLTIENEEQLIERSADLAVRLAYRIDKIIESDDEQGDR